MVSGSISSAISTMLGNEVLRVCLRNENLAQISKDESEFLLNAIGVKELLLDSSRYAQTCYNTTYVGGLIRCEGFIVRSLPTVEMDIHASCPFHETICRSANGNLRLDTGYVDSNDHIGLNAPVSERFAWRYVLHCAPLQTYNYTSHGLRGKIPVVRYYYGTRIELPENNRKGQDYTLEEHDVDTQYSLIDSSGSNFQLR
jgi:hypothetical protein